MSGDFTNYRGRLAPSPTGLLHLGHARTFYIAQQRAENGTLILRDDDLDGPRCTPEFAAAAREDLLWLGLRWQEGPYRQSEGMPRYVAAFERLRASGLIYPCACSRKEILHALSAPHAGEEEPIYPGTCRPALAAVSGTMRAGVNWRLRISQGEAVEFCDGHFGPQRAVAGVDFGDLLVWRKDDFPSYQLACVVDDADHGITEVVRGADLLTSTARQLLLYRALSTPAPAFYHCSLVLDAQGQRLAKRSAALSLRALREQGCTPAEIVAGFDCASPQSQRMGARETL